MWHIGGLLAAEAPTSGGNDQLLVMIGGIVVAAIGAAATVLVAALNRSNKTAPSPPGASGPGSDMAFRDYVIGEIAVGRKRDDDGDERDEIQDRRLDQIERVLDLDNPEWRHRD